jgi:hypothetical protein
MDRKENNASNNSCIVGCVFVATGTCLQRRFLARIGDTHTDTDSWEGFMGYAVEMGLDVTIYIKSLINIGSGIQKFKREV